MDLLVILPEVVDKRDTAVKIRRPLGDLPVCKDIVAATPEEATRRGHLAGTVFRSALREGRVVFEGPAIFEENPPLESVIRRSEPSASQLRRRSVHRWAR